MYLTCICNPLHFHYSLFSFLLLLSPSLSLSLFLSSYFSLHICCCVVDARVKVRRSLSLPLPLSFCTLSCLWNSLPRLNLFLLFLHLLFISASLTAIKWAWTEMWFTKWSWAYIKSSECASDGMDVYTPLKAIFQLSLFFPLSLAFYLCHPADAVRRARLLI